jgi:hypothetical protein
VEWDAEMVEESQGGSWHSSQCGHPNGWSIQGAQRTRYQSGEYHLYLQVERQARLPQVALASTQQIEGPQTATDPETGETATAKQSPGAMPLLSVQVAEHESKDGGCAAVCWHESTTCRWIQCGRRSHPRMQSSVTCRNCGSDASLQRVCSHRKQEMFSYEFVGEIVEIGR